METRVDITADDIEEVSVGNGGERGEFEVTSLSAVTIPLAGAIRENDESDPNGALYRCQGCDEALHDNGSGEYVTDDSDNCSMHKCERCGGCGYLPDHVTTGEDEDCPDCSATGLQGHVPTLTPLSWAKMVHVSLNEDSNSITVTITAAADSVEDGHGALERSLTVYGVEGGGLFVNYGSILPIGGVRIGDLR